MLNVELIKISVFKMQFVKYSIRKTQDWVYYPYMDFGIYSRDCPT